MTWLKVRPGIEALMVLVLASVVGAQSPDSTKDKRSGGWWDDLLEDRTLPLAKILAHPAALRGQTVRFVFQFHGPTQCANPYHTKFETDWYQNLSGWTNEAPLWSKDVYRKPFRNLFVKRGTEAERDLATAKEYARFVAVGEVTEIIRGEPWIEITGVEPLPTRLNEPALVHLVKGFMLKKLRRWDAAASAFRAADDASIPERVRAMAIREEAMALSEAGKTSLALSRIETALRVSPKDPASEALRDVWRTRVKDQNRRPGTEEVEPPPPPVSPPGGQPAK
ncbi:MAG: hypothetical protein CMJ83_19835 [Planctomycetes bacterium]|nr:hypothetical protein [Planctomycetota bacterium]